jgi:F-type H+-transporting ATPase subunit gamma
MPGSKEIRTKIKSVQNTRKITKAMEMVAASKMRKAQERMRAARPYSEKIRRLAANLSQANVTEYRHAFLSRGEVAEVKRVGLIVVTTDKGLCGGLNTNVLRQALSSMRQWQAGGVTDIQVTCIGNKGLGFMQRAGAKVISHVTHLGDTPHLDKLVGPVKVMIDAFRNGELDAVHLAYTRFINTMKQEPVIEPLLPLSGERMGTPDRSWDYLYEPDAQVVIGRIAAALCRGTDLPGRRRKHGLRTVGTHGGDEGGDRQRGQRDQGTATDLQQGTPGGDHQGNFRNCRWRCGDRRMIGRG